MSGTPAQPTPRTAPSLGRRPLLAGAGLTGAAALAAAGLPTGAALAAGPAAGAGRGRRERTRLTVLGTTDLHGNVLNWDYVKDAEFTNASGDDIGVAKVATLVAALQEQRRGEPLLTIDAGDTIQGTPLAYYYARVAPVTEGGTHPMAAAMNLLGYDAAALGNHEFNYGIDVLRRFESQLDFPLLGANAVDPATKRPVFPPYVVRSFRTSRWGKRLTVGVLGLTNPGIAIWDKAHVEGRMEFPGLVEQARAYVPRLKKAGCDVVVVAAHSGADTSSSYGDALPYPENAATLLAQQVPDVDAVLVGHAHQEITQRLVRNETTGADVLLCEPLYWGMRLAVMELDLELRGGRWRVVGRASHTLNANTAAERADVRAAVQAQHDVVVAYVNSVIGTSATELSAGRAVVEDVPLIELVNHVQAADVKAALAGGPHADLPVLSIAAPSNRSATFPAGEVTVRDVGALYAFDNTLLAVEVTGAQLRDYLEFSARYYQPQSSAGPVPVAQVTNAVTPTAPRGTPDYDLDVVAGLDAPLAYDVDLARPVGERIVGLSYAGVPVAADQRFALAVNNYRQSGGGGFPHVATAPVLDSRRVEIRQLVIDWVTARGQVDPADFASVDWRLVVDGTPLRVTT